MTNKINVCIIIIILLFLYYFQSYNVQIIDDFLSKEECDTLISIATNNNLLRRSKVSTAHGRRESKNRTSSSCFLVPNAETKTFLANLDNRIEKLTLVPHSHYEKFQIGKYLPSQKYEAHYDACYYDTKGGMRNITVLIYLNDNFTGGNTYFPSLNKTIHPRTGRAVMFNNLMPWPFHCYKHFRSKHAGLPVTSGTKYVCNKWIRRNKYN